MSMDTFDDAPEAGEMEEVDQCSNPQPTATTTEGVAGTNGPGVFLAANSNDDKEEELHRPILVGYAFGPKKMSTMGIIMAEASRAVSTVVTATVPPKDLDVCPQATSLGKGTDSVGDHKRHRWQWDNDDGSRVSAAEASAEAVASKGLVKSSSKRQKFQSEDEKGMLAGSETEIKGKLTAAGDGVGEWDDFDVEGDEESSSMTSLCVRDSFCDSTTALGCGGGAGSGSMLISFSSSPGFGVQNVARLFQPSCSSSASVTDCSMGTSVTPVAVAPSLSSGMKPFSTDSGQNWRPIRVSFVPLDLDSPLEEQHGGKFDAILHKLTEDILAISRMSSKSPDNSLWPASDYFSAIDLDEHQRQAITRVSRLDDYKLSNPACSLVDDPTNIRALMSRSTIAKTLSECLVGVTTRSGISVSTPMFYVAANLGLGYDRDSCSSRKLAEAIHDAPFSYPLIAKPLTAAGTVESHRMVVVLGESGLQRVQTPCVLQEYANHNKTLFKVYVLGDTVRVFPRPSLPDLPCPKCLTKLSVRSDYVEFDSQRPYPKLVDFGVIEQFLGHEKGCEACENQPLCSPSHLHRKPNCVETQSISSTSTRCDYERGRKGSSTPNASSQTPSAFGPFNSAQELQCSSDVVTADEIRPVATTLRKAFGLELFGFDILVTEYGPRTCRRCREDAEGGIKSSGNKKQILVVDVNYFPSYKEVSNFPSLLAQYLAQRAIESRMNTSKS